MDDKHTYRDVLRQVRKDLIDCANSKSWKKKTLIFFISLNFQVLFLYRHTRYLQHKSKLHKLLVLVFSYISKIVFQCHISERARIGTNLKMPHPTGIVIGDDVLIGDNVTIYQQVTLGSHGKSGFERAYPIIEDNVVIYAGAKVIGNITIGRNAVIGANAVVIKDVPPNAVAVGVPAKTIEKRVDKIG
ncbi:serine O-acetyltransferase EpsC [Paenibacillus mendelii]|uniref:Serine acetyltransferase n=1 Tax=Paenibacillus mendelii TaxID=206163 RepID=A0ABV6JJ66_9BACL|nr:serine O-acetyltransferase EpsC [Paenibacillus mendelii]MCQ6558893.1 serine O-acetyltransferase [Paenibacillus mendelii]